MVYFVALNNITPYGSEVDPTGSLWYKVHTLILPVLLGSEVDPTGSLWYTDLVTHAALEAVLKLTLPGHYGIGNGICYGGIGGSEVDPTGSLWYTISLYNTFPNQVLKLTLPGHYGITCRWRTCGTRPF